MFGNILEPCCNNPKTGFFRNGLCDTCSEDFGFHTVCIMVTKEFLEFSKKMGNDLSTPNPAYNFPGLKPGDKWCLCAMRWKEALDHNMAPPVYLEYSTIKDIESAMLRTEEAIPRVSIDNRRGFFPLFRHR